MPLFRLGRSTRIDHWDWQDIANTERRINVQIPTQVDEDARVPFEFDMDVFYAMLCLRSRGVNLNDILVSDVADVVKMFRSYKLKSNILMHVKKSIIRMVQTSYSMFGVYASRDECGKETHVESEHYFHLLDEVKLMKWKRTTSGLRLRGVEVNRGVIRNIDSGFSRTLRGYEAYSPGLPRRLYVYLERHHGTKIKEGIDRKFVIGIKKLANRMPICEDRMERSYILGKFKKAFDGIQSTGFVGRVDIEDDNISFIFPTITGRMPVTNGEVFAEMIQSDVYRPVALDICMNGSLEAEEVLANLHYAEQMQDEWERKGDRGHIKKFVKACREGELLDEEALAQVQIEEDITHVDSGELKRRKDRKNLMKKFRKEKDRANKIALGYYADDIDRFYEQGESVKQGILYSGRTQLAEETDLWELEHKFLPEIKSKRIRTLIAKCKKKRQKCKNE